MPNPKLIMRLGRGFKEAGIDRINPEPGFFVAPEGEEFNPKELTYFGATTVTGKAVCKNSAISVLLGKAIKRAEELKADFVLYDESRIFSKGTTKVTMNPEYRLTVDLYLKSLSE